VDLPSGREVACLRVTVPASLAFAGPGLLACVRFGEALDLFDLERGQVRASFDDRDGVPRLVSATRDARLAVGYADGRAAILEVPEREPTPQEAREAARAEATRRAEALVRALARGRERAGYRDAPALGSVDADGLGLRLARAGVALHVRLEITEAGFRVTMRGGAPDAPAPAAQARERASLVRALARSVRRWLGRGSRRGENAPRPDDRSWVARTLGSRRSVRSRILEDGTLRLELGREELPEPAQIEALAEAYASRRRSAPERGSG
jgi:hypothetical protein